VFEIGTALRTARERQGLDWADLEHRTHIRERYLRALEDESFEVIPGRAYAKGFLRVYAESLGLDGQRLVDELNERYPEVEPLELETHVPVGVRRRPSGRRLAAALAAVALALVGVLAWRLGGGHHTSPLAARPAVAPAPHPHVQPRHRHVTPAASTAQLILRATGPCWVSVRIGSESGATLYEGTLVAGGALRYTLAPSRPRLWLRIGAPWDLRLALNGKRTGRLLTGPGNLVATRTGLHTA
jgi:hypothetical protein